MRGFETNVRGTWVLLDACVAEGVERVVVASSDKAYGRHDELPYREDFALRPTAPYEASKAAADLIARSYWPSFGLPVAVTRFANLYGGGDLNFSRLVPEAVCAALDGRAPVLRSDGSPAARLPLRRGRRRRLPGDRRRPRPRRGPRRGLQRRRRRARTRWARWWRRSRASPGPGVEPEIRGIGNPEGEIDRQYVDATKLREACGWEPAVELEEGLRRTIEWYREHPEARPAQSSRS